MRLKAGEKAGGHGRRAGWGCDGSEGWGEGSVAEGLLAGGPRGQLGSSPSTAGG